jgi:hypothetical protein
MKVRLFLKSVVFGLACLGLTIGHADVLAGPKTKTTASKLKISDVSLDSKGIFNGIVADKDGRPIGLSEVVIAQGKRVVAKTKTNERGEFQVAKLRGGNYQVVVAKQIGHVRLWKNGTAPPKAMQQALLISRPVVRGQSAIGSLGGATGLFNLAAGVTAVTLGIVNNNDISDLQNDIDRVQTQVTNIANTINNLTP